jgi:MFS family permease
MLALASDDEVDLAPKRCCRLRYAVLALASVFPFGAHVAYKQTSAIEDYMNPFLNITHAQYGNLNSAVSWASLAGVPLLCGVLLDAKPSRYATLLFTAAAMLGQLLFAISVSSGSYPASLFARCMFGIGESTMDTVQGTVMVQWFRSTNQVSLAIGVSEASHNLSDWLGKVSIAVGLAVGGWQATLWFGLFCCGVSVACVVVYSVVERRSELRPPPDFDATKREVQCGSSGGGVARGGVGQLSCMYWLFVLLHLIVSTVDQLFDSVSSDFIHQKWGVDYVKAAWLSSVNYAIAVVLSPLVGLLVDRVGHRATAAGAACLLQAAAYLMLGQLTLDPLVPLVMLSISASILPVLIRACVPLVVPHEVSGLAYGLYGVAENLGKVAGGPLVGYFRDTTGDYVADSWLWASLSVLGVFCCAAIAFADRHKGGVLAKGGRGPWRGRSGQPSDVAAGGPSASGGAKGAVQESAGAGGSEQLYDEGDRARLHQVERGQVREQELYTVAVHS